jgi:hypothetical protein
MLTNLVLNKFFLRLLNKIALLIFLFCFNVLKSQTNFHLGIGTYISKNYLGPDLKIRPLPYVSGEVVFKNHMNISLFTSMSEKWQETLGSLGPTPSISGYRVFMNGIDLGRKFDNNRFSINPNLSVLYQNFKFFSESISGPTYSNHFRHMFYYGVSLKGGFMINKKFELFCTVPFYFYYSNIHTSWSNITTNGSINASKTYNRGVVNNSFFHINLGVNYLIR